MLYISRKFLPTRNRTPPQPILQIFNLIRETAGLWHRIDTEANHYYEGEKTIPELSFMTIPSGG